MPACVRLHACESVCVKLRAREVRAREIACVWKCALCMRVKGLAWEKSACV